MASIKLLAKQTVIYGLTSIVGKMLNYLLVPLHTYLFLPKEYGVVSEMYAWIGLFVVILSFGMETAFFRYSVLEKDKNKVFTTALWPLLILVVTFIITIIFSAQNIADILNYSLHPEYIRWLSLIIGADVLSSLFFARLRNLDKSLVFAGIKLTNIFINCFLNLFFLLLCPWLVKNGILTELTNLVYDSSVGVGYIFISNLVASLVVLVLLFIEKRRIEFVLDRILLKKMFFFAFPMLIYNLSGVVNETFDRILLKYLSPQDIAQAQVGIYSACYKISVMMTILIQAFKYAAEPFYFKESIKSDAKETYSTVMDYFILIGSIVFLLIILNIDIVKFFIGSRYHEGMGVVPILLLANLFLGIFYNLSVWYKNTDRPKYGAYISIVGVLITLVLNYLLIPLIGYYGAAWATLICNFGMMCLSYILGQKYYRTDYHLKTIAFYFFLALAVFGLSYLNTVENTVLKLMINNLLIVGYLLIVYMVQPTAKKQQLKYWIRYKILKNKTTNLN